MVSDQAKELRRLINLIERADLIMIETGGLKVGLGADLQEVIGNALRLLEFHELLAKREEDDAKAPEPP